MSLALPRGWTHVACACAILVPQPGQAQFVSFYPAAKQGGFYMHNYYLPQPASSTPWAPSWSPDGKWIAVAMGGSIWKVEVATGNAEELTAGGTYHSSPNWSPDGRWLVYTADDAKKTIQLEMLNVATGVIHALTTDESALYLDPVFSPDGQRLAYVSTKPAGNFNVYIRPVREGQWAGDEIAVTADHSFGRERLYFGSWDMHISPAWLPNGTELLLVSNRDIPLGSGNVLRVPAVANGIERAKTVLVEQTLYRARPDVSIDGKRFVYSSTRGTADQYNNLYVQPTTGGEPYKLTFFTHDAFHPRWSPDGEWIAFITNEGGLPQLAVLETYGGAQRTIQIKERLWRRPMGRVQIRTIDATTGRTTEARIHVTASDGKFYAPADAYARLDGEGDHLFHTIGRATLNVPAGPIHLLAVKGFEFFPESTSVDVRPGADRTVTLNLRRMVNLAAKGWHSGSTHVHMNYAGNLHNTLDNLLMMSAAEDQDVLLELVANKDNRVLDHQYFLPGGRAHPLSRQNLLLAVGEEYRPPFYGHVYFLGLRDHLISPFTTGYEGTGIESLYPSNTDMMRKAKDQGAVTGYVHAYFGDADPMTIGLGGGKGFMVDAALGTTDALEWSYSNRSSFFPWYAVLNNGIRIAATGGEDAISSMHWSKLVGSLRTYVHTGAKGLTFPAILEGIRKGRSFVTSGPVIELTANGRGPGDDITLSAGGSLMVAAQVQSVTPLEKVFLVYNGETVKEIPLSPDRRSAKMHELIPVTQSGWLHLRAEGKPTERFPLDANYAQAFTNPIWVTVGGKPVRNKAAAEYGIRWVDSLQTQAQAWPGWRSDKEKQHVFAQFEAARATYRRLANEAERK